jgi:hypothetical protein
MDLENVGGPTGLGSQSLDAGIRSYQKRNGLKVDGWVRPGGPTITKMKEQYGGLLGDYEAPTPQESDTHHRLRDAGLDGFLKPKRQELLLPPIPGLPKPDDDILGANQSLARTVRDDGMRDTPAYMAKLVRHQGQQGVVEARNFVDQLEQLIPGQGTKAIRGILQALADTPQLQRNFFGGPVIEIAPIGVFEQDGPKRYEDAIRTRSWEDVAQGRTPPTAPPIRDAAYRPERDGPLDDPRPLGTHKTETPEEEARNRVPISCRPDGQDVPPNPNDFLDPRNWPTAGRAQDKTPNGQDTEQQEDALEIKATATDTEDGEAHAIQIAQAQGPQHRPQQRPAVTPPANRQSQGPQSQTSDRPSPAPRRQVESWGDLRQEFHESIAVAEGGKAVPKDDAIGSSIQGGRRRQVLGRYQLAELTLEKLGLRSADGTWVPGKISMIVDGQSVNVQTDADFLGSREAQDQAMRILMTANQREAVTRGFTNRIDTTIKGKEETFQITEAGLAAAMHRVGGRHLLDYFRRMEKNDWDSNRASRNLRGDAR